MAGPLPFPFADVIGPPNPNVGKYVKAPATTEPPSFTEAVGKVWSGEAQGEANASGQPVLGVPPEGYDPGKRVSNPYPDVGEDPGGGKSGEATTALVGNSLGANAYGDAAFPLMAPVRPNVGVMEEGENWHMTGGVHGKEWFDKATDPSGTIGAINAGMAALEAKNKETGAVLESEQKRRVNSMASIQSRRNDDMAEEQRRLAYLDNETQRVTANLQSQGAFWSNPGNIISAIAYSLMPIAGGDPANGARLINQAIDADFHRRKTAADTYLGELKSNLGNYRQLAGNRQAGDMLAEAEARRVAALEVERIANRFATPESRAKADATIQELSNQSFQLKMQARKMYGVQVDPRVMPKPLIDAYKRGGQDGVGYQPYAGPPQPPTKPAPGAPGAAAMGSVGQGSPTTANTGSAMPATRMAALQAAGPEEVLAQALKGQLTPKDISAYIGADNTRRILAEHPEGGIAFNRAMQQMRRVTEDELKTVSQPLQQHASDHKALSMLQSDLDYMSNWYKTHPKEGNPDKFLKDIARDATSYANWYNEMKLKYGEPGTKEEADLRNMLQNSQRIHQLFAQNRMNAIHGYAGSALSATELELLNNIIVQNPGFGTMRNFVNNQSQQAVAQVHNALGAVSPNARLYWLAGNPGILNARLDAPGISKPAK